MNNFNDRLIQIVRLKHHFSNHLHEHSIGHVTEGARLSVARADRQSSTDLCLAGNFGCSIDLRRISKTIYINIDTRRT